MGALSENSVISDFFVYDSQGASSVQTIFRVLVTRLENNCASLGQGHQQKAKESWGDWSATQQH